jgi:hypothetical protein
VLRTFNDSYIQAKFEVAISQLFQDIYREKISLLHPEMSMDTSTKCAALLRKYLSDQVQAARGEKEKESNWEPHPHSFFYSAEGEYQKIKFSPIPSDIVKSKDMCEWHLGYLLQVKEYNNKIIQCRSGAKYRFAHNDLREINRKQAEDAIRRVKGDSLQKAFTISMNGTHPFKK